MSVCGSVGQRMAAVLLVVGWATSPALGAPIQQDSPQASARSQQCEPSPGLRPASAAVFPATDPDFARKAWEKAFQDAIRARPSEVYAPPKPAPKLRRMMIS